MPELELQDVSGHAALPESGQDGALLVVLEDRVVVLRQLLGRHLDRQDLLPGVAFAVADIHFQSLYLHIHPGLVREGGVEPPRVSSRDPKSRASASSATLASAYRVPILSPKCLCFKRIAWLPTGPPRRPAPPPRSARRKALNRPPPPNPGLPRGASDTFPPQLRSPSPRRRASRRGRSRGC